MNKQHVWTCVWVACLSFSYAGACQAQDITAEIIREYTNRLALYPRGSCSGTEQSSMNPEAEKQILEETANSAGKAAARSIERQRNAIGDRRTVTVESSPFFSAFDGTREYSSSKIDAKTFSFDSVMVTHGRDTHSRTDYPNSYRNINVISGHSSTWLKTTLLYAPLGEQIENEKSVAELFQSGQYKFVKTVQDEKYGPLAVYSRQGDYNRTFNLFFSPHYSNTIVKAESMNAHFRETYDVESLEQVGNLYLPKVATDEFVLYKPNGTSSVFTHKIRTVDAISFEAPNPALFDMGLKPRDIVKDNMTGEVWTVGPHGEKIHNMEKSSASQSTMYFGWLYMASVTTMLILTVGAYVRWKRKQFAKPA